jgi:hypothetical protein
VNMKRIYNMEREVDNSKRVKRKMLMMMMA